MLKNTKCSSSTGFEVVLCSKAVAGLCGMGNPDQLFKQGGTTGSKNINTVCLIRRRIKRNGQKNYRAL